MKVYKPTDTFPVNDIISFLSEATFSVDIIVRKLAGAIDKSESVSRLLSEYIDMLRALSTYSEDLVGFGNFKRVPLDAVESNGVVIDGKLYPYVKVESRWLVSTTVEGHLYREGSRVSIPNECIAEGYLQFYEDGSTEVINQTTVSMLFDNDISTAYHLEVAVPVNYKGAATRIADVMFKVQVKPAGGPVFVPQFKIYVKSGSIKDILVNGSSRMEDIHFVEPYWQLDIFDNVDEIWLHLGT